MISVYFSIDPTIQTYLYNILLWLQTAVQGYLAGFTSQTTQTYSNEILYPSDYRAIRPEVSSSLASSLRGGKHVETYGSKFSILSTVWLIFVSVWWFQMCFLCSAQPYLGCCFSVVFFPWVEATKQYEKVSICWVHWYPNFDSYPYPRSLISFILQILSDGRC